MTQRDYIKNKQKHFYLNLGQTVMVPFSQCPEMTLKCVANSLLSSFTQQSVWEKVCHFIKCRIYHSPSYPDRTGKPTRTGSAAPGVDPVLGPGPGPGPGPAVAGV